MKKEVAAVRKKIDMANRDLKPLGQSCQKKVFAFMILSSSHLAHSSVALILTRNGFLKFNPLSFSDYLHPDINSVGFLFFCFP
jgi:hypothetical protein